MFVTTLLSNRNRTTRHSRAMTSSVRIFVCAATSISLAHVFVYASIVRVNPGRRRFLDFFRSCGGRPIFAPRPFGRNSSLHLMLSCSPSTIETRLRRTRCRHAIRPESSDTPLKSLRLKSLGFRRVSRTPGATVSWDRPQESQNGSFDEARDA